MDEEKVETTQPRILNAQSVVRGVENYSTVGVDIEENESLVEEIERLDKQIRYYKIVTATALGLSLIVFVARMIAL